MINVVVGLRRPMNPSVPLPIQLLLCPFSKTNKISGDSKLIWQIKQIEKINQLLKTLRNTSLLYSPADYTPNVTMAVI